MFFVEYNRDGNLQWKDVISELLNFFASIDTLVDVDFGLDGKYTCSKLKLF